MECKKGRRYMAKSKKIDELCDAMAAIGLAKAPPHHDQAMKDEGWMSVMDVIDITGQGTTSIRRKMALAVKDGSWESTPALLLETNSIMTVYRPKA